MLFCWQVQVKNDHYQKDNSSFLDKLEWFSTVVWLSRRGKLLALEWLCQNRANTHVHTVIHTCCFLFRFLLWPSCGQLYFTVTLTVKEPLILFEEVWPVNCRLNGCWVNSLLSIKLLCFYSLKFSKSLAGGAADSVWLLMAFLHIPMRSSLAGRKASTDSGHFRTMRRSKAKAAVAPNTVWSELDLPAGLVFDSSSCYQFYYYSAFSRKRCCPCQSNCCVAVHCTDTRCVSCLTDSSGLT